MATDPVVTILRDGITTAEQEKQDLQAKIGEINSRIARLKTAITAVGTAVGTTTTAISTGKAARKRTKRGARPWFVSEATVDTVRKAIAGNSGSPTITELSKKTGYSIASIEDATKTLLERKIVTRERVAGEKGFRYSPSGSEN